MYSAVHCCMCLTPLPPARATGAAATVLSPGCACRPSTSSSVESRFIGGYKGIVADLPWDFNGAVSIARRS